jgi:hypothetical protein
MRLLELRVLAALTAAVVLTLWVGQVQADLFEVRVIDGNDDAEEHLTEGNTIDLTSTDLEIPDEGGGGDVQDIGIRFQGVNIPAGSIITSAAIQFTVDELDDEDTSVTIFGELSANPLAYTDTAGSISSRAKTTSFADWNNIPLWSVEGEAGPDQRTPDLAVVVQEIIDLAGWASGNSMAFVISPNPGGERTAESYNGAADHGNLDLAPLLQVEFNPIPEPSSMVLAALAGVSVLAFRRRGR